MADDVAAAVALLRAQLQEHDIETDEQGLREVVQAVVSDAEHGLILVAEQNGAPVGIAYAAAHLSAEHGGIIGWLEELYVLPEARCAGVGSMLLRALIERAQELAWRGLELEVVAGHERAMPLYRRYDFVPVERARFSRIFPR